MGRFRNSKRKPDKCKAQNQARYKHYFGAVVIYLITFLSISFFDIAAVQAVTYCPPDYSYNETSLKCEASACPDGSLDPSRDACLQNAAYACAKSAYTFNSSTYRTCPCDAVYNAATHRCEAGSSTPCPCGYGAVSDGQGDFKR